MIEVCFEELAASTLAKMPRGLYIAYHYVVNSLHWIWEGAPLTDELQINMHAAEYQLEHHVNAWSDACDYEYNLDLMYKLIREDVESRKKAALDKINPAATDD